MQSNFMFYDNFLEAINQLPESERANACYQFCKYAITEELPEDKSLAMFCVGVRYSVHKYQGRGGARVGAGRPKKSNEEENQKNQNIQKNQNTQTETETETETKENTIKEKSGGGVIDWADVLDRWNRIAEKYKLSKISVITDKRKQQFKARLAEHKLTPVEFFGIVNKGIGTSWFLQGQRQEVGSDGIPQMVELDNKWKASFDFCLQSQSFSRIRENFYGKDCPELLVEWELLEKGEGNADQTQTM